MTPRHVLPQNRWYHRSIVQYSSRSWVRSSLSRVLWLLLLSSNRPATSIFLILGSLNEGHGNALRVIDVQVDGINARCAVALLADGIIALPGKRCSD